MVIRSNNILPHIARIPDKDWKCAICWDSEWNYNGKKIVTIYCNDQTSANCRQIFHFKCYFTWYDRAQALGQRPLEKCLYCNQDIQSIVASSSGSEQKSEKTSISRLPSPKNMCIIIKPIVIIFMSIALAYFS